MCIHPFFMEQLTGSEHEKQYAKCPAQKIGGYDGGAVGGEWGDQTAGERAPEKSRFDDPIMLPVRDECGRRTTQKVQQIDTRSRELSDSLHGGEPYNEQGTSSDTESGQNAGECTDEDAAYHSSTERTPPQSRRSPNRRRSREGDVLRNSRPDRMPPTKPPIRYGVAKLRSMVPRDT